MVGDLIAFPFTSLGEVKQIINNQTYTFVFDICDHGVRISTRATFVEQFDDYATEHTRKIYFGEGYWLTLPGIEETVLEVLDGTMEDVEQLVEEYDALVFVGIAHALTGGQAKGFILEEAERLKQEGDL